ncbi:MAG: hypothetical protein AB1641_00975 [Thermodesulfobacteriota bacterium]
MDLPSLHRVRQKFSTAREADPAGAIEREFQRLDLKSRVQPGRSVAVAVGSRGINALPLLVATVIRLLKEMGLRPFILPAMGSHGGATGPGQAKLLEHLGVTEESVGAPVVSNMDVVSLGRLANGAEAFLARDALQAGHLLVMNRVKPHTAFRGRVESGLCKMLAVGCGKHQGALNMHKFGLAETIIPAARTILEQAPVLAGLALVENSLERIHTVRLAGPRDFVETDEELLDLAWSLLPRLPLDRLDVLIVDEMGKNISGAGLDPNVTGLWRRDGGPRVPDYRTLIVLDLTDESGGNAMGIGMVDLTTRRVLDKVDLKATYTNALTTGIWPSVRLPLALENDREVVTTALSRASRPDQVRLVRIVNTLELETFWVSAALLPELRDRPDLEVDLDPRPLVFDPAGRLLPFEGGKPGKKSSSPVQNDN